MYNAEIYLEGMGDGGDCVLLTWTSPRTVDNYSVTNRVVAADSGDDENGVDGVPSSPNIISIFLESAPTTRAVNACVPAINRLRRSSDLHSTYHGSIPLHERLGHGAVIGRVHGPKRV